MPRLPANCAAGPLAVASSVKVDPDARCAVPKLAHVTSTGPAGFRGPVVFCLAAVMGIALLLRTQHLSDVTMYFDECCSWKISQFPWNEMLDAVSRDAHPPVYYVLLKGLGASVGDSPRVIRGFSVVFGLATVLAAFWFVRTALADQLRPCDADVPEATAHWDDGASTNSPRVVHRDFTAVLAALLVATSALQIEVSLQARPYTLGTFLTLVSATFLLRGLRPAGPAADWIAFVVTATLLSLTHYYCLFTVGALFLYGAGVLGMRFWRMGWNPPVKRPLLGLGLSAWGMQLVWLSWLPVFQFQHGRSTPQLWMQPLELNAFFANCWMALAGGKTLAAPDHWAWTAFAAWVAAVLALLVSATRGGRLAALCAGLPLLGVALYSVAVRNILGVKYLAFAQVFLLIAWAMLAGRIPCRSGRLAVTIGLLVWSEFWCWMFTETRSWQATLPGVSGAVEYLEQRRLPEEPVIVASPFIFVIAQKYSQHPEGIYVKYSGDHRGDMLGGPPLLESEYRDISRHFHGPGDRAWGIDVFELFGPESRFEARPPGEWVLVNQQGFREAHGLPCLVAVREYRRQSASHE